MIASIYSRWVADATLLALVPADQITQGWFFETPSQYPYVAIEDAGNAAGEYTSSSVALEHHLVRFHVFDDDLDRINGNILPAIRAEYNRQNFAGVRGTVLNLQWQGDSIMYAPDGTYHAISNYIGTVEAGIGV